MMTDMLTDSESFCLLAAVRYACGRETYAPTIVISEVRRLIPRIPHNDRGTIARDIREYVEYRDRLISIRPPINKVPDGHNWNRAEWEFLASELEAVNGQLTTTGEPTDV